MEGEDRRVGGGILVSLDLGLPSQRHPSKTSLHSLFWNKPPETFKMSFFKAKKGGAAASKEEMRHRREVKRFLYENQKNKKQEKQTSMKNAIKNAIKKRRRGPHHKAQDRVPLSFFTWRRKRTWH